MATREQQPSDTQQELRDQSTGDLVKQLSQQVTTLVRQEVELAKAEMGEKGRKAGVGLGMFGGAGVAGLLALGSLTAFLILVFDLAIPTWAAALIVTVLWAAVAGVLALQGREKVREVGKPIPEQTAESVKEDVEWLKGHRK
ncbi:MAG: phage holin family protein [Actinobacteria bacterium]|nr:phage holin family protein [Actinomycetota bacterium]